MVPNLVKSEKNLYTYNDKAESIINKLLENGDIFEIKPGKLKVLE